MAIDITIDLITSSGRGRSPRGGVPMTQTSSLDGPSFGGSDPRWEPHRDERDDRGRVHYGPGCFPSLRPLHPAGDEAFASERIFPKGKTRFPMSEKLTCGGNSTR